MRSRSLPRRSLWTESAENLSIVFGQCYSSSTRYGAGLKEALRATLMLGLACVPSCCSALSTNKLRALSNEAGTRMILYRLQSVYQLFVKPCRWAGIAQCMKQLRFKKLQRVALRDGARKPQIQENCRLVKGMIINASSVPIEKINVSDS